jgi:DNA-binding CsgD family transcriptional regulator
MPVRSAQISDIDAVFDVLWSDAEQSYQFPQKESVMPIGYNFSKKRSTDLTRRELQIVQLLVDGMGNRAIGQMLNIHEDTVKYHLHNACNKTGADNRIALARWALTEGHYKGGYVKCSHSVECAELKERLVKLRTEIDQILTNF